SWNLDDFERPDREHNARKAHRIAFQNGIVSARGGFRAIAGLVGVVFCLSPARQRRKVVSRSLPSTAGSELPHAGQIMYIESRFRCPGTRRNQKDRDWDRYHASQDFLQKTPACARDYHDTHDKIKLGELGTSPVFTLLAPL